MLQFRKIAGSSRSKERKSIITSIMFLCLFTVKFSNGVIFTSKREKDTESNARRENEMDTHDGFDSKLIDALEINPSSRFGFLVVVNIQPVKYAKCTGSLLNDEWVVTAAHCMGKKAWITQEDCGSELLPPVDLQCETLDNGDLKINIVGSENRPKVYIGMHNMLEESETSDAIDIDYIIRPEKSYPGGNYGGYGGYDIVLLKLSKKATFSKDKKPYSRVCLPENEEFNDQGHAMVAGYGRYRRAPCEVGRQGPEKFEYCGTAESCAKGSKGHQRSNCTIRWEYNGNHVEGCSHDPTPSSSDKKCRTFLEKANFEWPEDVDEVALVDAFSKQIATTCYRNDPGSYGWCGTVHHQPQHTRSSSRLRKQHIDVSKDKGWGFCQRSCYPETEVALGGIERFKTVDVLEDGFCDTTLSPSLKHKPNVLCIAFNFTYRTSFLDATTHKPIQLDLDTQLNLMNRKTNWYITGTGLCLGDSGGPLFKTYHTKDGSRMSVLIGVVSRGTGSRGNCGGLNNATHYVRIKMFLDWIMMYIKKEDLCFFNQNSDRSDNSENGKPKEISPHEIFKTHINNDDESRRKAEEDIKKQDPKP